MASAKKPKKQKTKVRFKELKASKNPKGGTASVGDNYAPTRLHKPI